MVSPECKDLIKKLLLPREKRISLENIYKHEWLKKDPISKIPLKINFSNMMSFSKASKVNQHLILVKKDYHNLHRVTILRKRSRVARNFVPTNGS